MQKIENYLKDEDAAKFINVGLQTLRNRRTQCRPPAYIKIGRSVRYAIEDLRAFMEENKINNK